VTGTLALAPFHHFARRFCLFWPVSGSTTKNPRRRGINYFTNDGRRFGYTPGD
jgi:hypothetical protein